MYEKSEEYSWAYVTEDRMLHRGPCELLCAELDPSGPNADSTIYDGTDTAGRKITGIQAKQKTNRPFNPKAPVKCEQGLYVDIGTATTGVFVQWRGL